MTLNIPHGQQNWDTQLLAEINAKADQGSVTSAIGTQHTTDSGTYVPALVMTGTGIDPTGVADSTAAIQAKINVALARDDKVCYIPGGVYRLNSGLTIGGGARPGTNGGTELHFYGTGTVFTNGSDDSLAYDRAGYDGPQDIELSDCYLVCDDSIRTTPLGNGMGNYASGRYGFRDWRGGKIKLRNVWMQGFDTGFWGIQSDINKFDHTTTGFCRIGFYIGPRSDQNLFDHPYSFFCDTAIKIDGAHKARINEGQFDGDGAPGLYPIMVGGGAWARGSVGTTINNCWLEHYTGTGYATLDAYVGIGTLGGDTVQAKGVVIRDPSVFASPGIVAAIVTIGNGTYVELDTPTGDVGNVTDLARFVGTTSPWLKIRTNRNFDTGWTNAGTGSPDVSYEMNGFGANTIASTNNRLWNLWTPANTLRDHYMAMSGDRLWQINMNADPSGNNTRLSFARRIDYGSAAPTTLAWLQGDRRFNDTPAEAGSAASKYVVTGWICTVAGTPGTWLEMRTLTGN